MSAISINGVICSRSNNNVDETMKILVIRLSSMGDIILTTPVLRCIKQQVEGAEVHCLVKTPFVSLLDRSPFVDRVYAYDEQNDVVNRLKQEKFDYVVDLQNNHRSRLMCRLLRCKRSVVKKEDFARWLLVVTKHNFIKHPSVVNRYMDAARPLGVVNDGGPLNLYYELQEANEKQRQPYVVIACGAQHGTKRIPPKQLQYLIGSIQGQIVLLGDKQDRYRIANDGVHLTPNVLNLCGKTSMEQLMQWVDKATVVISGDTGIMHMAAAFQKDLVVIWGGTTPLFGFAPYGVEARNCEADLWCRPCSRLGKRKCPQHTLRCFEDLPWQQIVNYVNARIQA